MLQNQHLEGDKDYKKKLDDLLDILIINRDLIDGFEYNYNKVIIYCDPNILSTLKKD